MSDSPTTPAHRIGQMTDNLRDRIAAALFRWDHPLSRNHAWDEAEDHVREDFRTAADVLIRELGIRQESCPCYHRGPNCGHRFYISDWTVG